MSTKCETLDDWRAHLKQQLTTIMDEICEELMIDDVEIWVKDAQIYLIEYLDDFKKSHGEDGV